MTDRTDHSEVVGHTPDYYYVVDAWECTFNSDLLAELEEDALGGDTHRVVKIGCLKELPPQWLANVPCSWDDEGEADGWEPRLFATQALARAAIQAATGANPNV